MTPSDLRQAIDDSGDTIANFASRVGVTAGTMTVWLKGPRELTKRASNAVQSTIKTYETAPPTRKMFSGPKRKA